MGKKIDKVLLLKIATVILLPLLVYLIPLNDVYTQQMRMFFVITIAAIALFAVEIIDNMLVSLLLPACYVLFSIASAEVVYKPWTQSMVWMIVGGFIFANALEECGLLKRTAYWIVKQCKGSFTKLLYCVFFAGLAIEALSFCNAWIVVFVVCYGLCVTLNFGKSKEAALIMFAGQIGTANACVYICNPVYWNLMQASVSNVVPGFSVPLYMQMVYGFPVFVIGLLTIFIFSKLFKTDAVQLANGADALELEYRKLGTMSKEERKATVIVAIMVAFLLTTSITKLDVNYGFLFITMLMFLPGIKVATSDSLKKVNLSILVFMTACMAIGNVATVIGVGALISTYFVPMLQNVSAGPFVFLCLILGIIGNVVMTPMALLSMFPGPLAGISMQLGFKSVLPSALAIMYTNDLVFFPYENTLTLVIFSYGMMSLKQFVKLNVVKMLIFLVGFAVLVIPFWMLLGLI